MRLRFRGPWTPFEPHRILARSSRTVRNPLRFAGRLRPRGTRPRHGASVPEVSRFFGIVIAMYYREHEPPHFHARYGEHRAILR